MSESNFSIGLQVPVSGFRCGRSFHVGSMEMENVIHALCQELSKYPDAKFWARGFELDWRIDISTDLVIIVPQIPGMLRRVHVGRNASIEFYEQGIERIIEICPAEGVLKCFDMVGKKPLGVSSLVTHDLINQSSAVLKSFISWSTSEFLDMSCYDIFQEWLSIVEEVDPRR